MLGEIHETVNQVFKASNLKQTKTLGKGEDLILVAFFRLRRWTAFMKLNDH
jgi:hypothetical protein